MTEKVRLVEESQALDSLRSSDFDSLSAYGEVIDNAIQAGASKISINFKVDQDGHRRHIETLAFRDNGSGMSKDVLQSCLRLGWSSRFNDRSGIGRFGVGMILGAIHECRRVEVYSKREGDPSWLFTYVDLDEIKTGDMDGIPEPISSTPPHEFLSLMSDDFGTLVLWKKYDRLKESVSKVIEDANHYIGRTFRHFIWDGLEVKLDGRVVFAHDPLFLRTDKTAFPDDPIGTAYDDIVIPYPIAEPDIRRAYDQDTSEVRIRLSLLPEEFRKVRGMGGGAEAAKRHIGPDQQGISILRERREVFFGHVNRWSLVKLFGSKNPSSWRFEEKDRWWGCEVSFGAELDSAFEVKNIKRGANPEADLKAMIKEQITPTRRTVLDIIDDVWRKEDERREKEKKEKDSELIRHPSHGESEEAVTVGGKGSKSKLGARKRPEELAEELRRTSLAAKDSAEQERYLALFNNQPLTIVDAHWKGPNFWEVQFAGDKIALEYNTSHEFIKEVRGLERRLAAETDPQELQKLALKVTTVVNLLLASLAKAQSQYEENESLPIAQLIEDMNTKWGIILRNFTSARPGLISGEGDQGV